jgi:hypothetical protein
MPQVTIKIGSSVSNQLVYTLSAEKIKYLLKFVDSITDESDSNTDLLKEIETSLKEVKKIRSGQLPRRTIKQMIHGK